MSLQQELKDLKTNILEQLPEAISEKFAQSIQDLDESGIASQFPKAGDTLRDFDLPNQTGQRRSSAELRRSGPVVIVFYRGGWCPYCNLELRAYQQILPQIKEAGAQLVAITPELPDSSLSTTEKNALEFEVLSDAGAGYAKEIGLAFTLPDELRATYAELGGDLEKFNGAGNFNLPVPGTLVVDTEGQIAFAQADVDYTTRANPEDVLKAVHNIQVTASA